MARKKVTQTAAATEETIIEQAVKEQVAELTEEKKEEPKKKDVLVIKKDTPLRRFPTLQQAHISGIAKAGTSFKVATKIGSPYGWFYKLANGRYILEDNVNILN